MTTSSKRTGLDLRPTRVEDVGSYVVDEVVEKVVESHALSRPFTKHVKANQKTKNPVFIGNFQQKRGLKVAPAAGFEPATNWLTANCATTALCWNKIPHSVVSFTKRKRA